MAITGGMAPAPALIGDDGTIDLAATMHGEDITLSNLAVGGKAVAIGAKGTLSQQAIDLDWSAALKDLSAVQPKLAGTLDAKGHASGSLSDLAVRGDVTTNISAQGYHSGQVTAHIDATGLPSAPKARVNADGTLLELATDAGADGGPDGRDDPCRHPKPLVEVAAGRRVGVDGAIGHAADRRHASQLRSAGRPAAAARQEAQRCGRRHPERGRHRPRALKSI